MKDINLAYLCIWDRVKNNSINKEMKLKDFKLTLLRVYHFPKRFVYPIIRDMENQGWIEWKNRKVIKILDPGIDIENTSKIYKKLGLF